MGSCWKLLEWGVTDCLCLPQGEVFLCSLFWPSERREERGADGTAQRRPEQCIAACYIQHAAML